MAEGMRRSDRLFAWVPIRVTGSDASGTRFEEETHTINMNKHGACISLSYTLEPGTKLHIRNLRNGVEEEFRVVGAVRQIFGSRQEWGVEALNPESGIWGVDFTPPSEGAQPKVLIQCSGCATDSLSLISPTEYGVLIFTGVISRYCARCDQTTRWGPSNNTPRGEEIVGVRAPAPVHLERGRERRVRMAMRLRIRISRGEAEMVQTVDVSRMGLCFASQRYYQPGEEILVTLPFGGWYEPKERRARIVWSRVGSRGTLYGVCHLE